MSDPLLFFTVPTSPPDDLKCTLNSDKSLEFTWKLPRKGMIDSTKKTDMNYHFAYWLKEKAGKYFLTEWHKIVLILI